MFWKKDSIFLIAFTIHASITYIRIKISVSSNPLVNHENQTNYTHFDAYHNNMCLVIDTQSNMFMASKKIVSLGD
jgi:hypothetical protein